MSKRDKDSRYVNPADLLNEVIGRLNAQYTKTHEGEEHIRLERSDDIETEWKVDGYRRYTVSIVLLEDGSVVFSEKVTYNPEIMNGEQLFKMKDEVHMKLLTLIAAWGISGCHRFRQDNMDWFNFEKRMRDKKKGKEKTEEMPF